MAAEAGLETMGLDPKDTSEVDFVTDNTNEVKEKRNVETGSQISE